MKALAAELRTEREQRKRRFTSRVPNSLLDYFCLLNPELIRPDWLEPIAALFERAFRRETVNATISAPPQHGKTEICKAGIVRLLEFRPKLRNAYISYSQDRAEDIGNEIRELAARRGIVTEGNSHKWKTKEGGGLLACGVYGALTGNPVDGIAVVDDLIQNSFEARSASKRDAKTDELKRSVITRVHPGVSVLNVATRWEPKDTTGVLISEGWENVNLAAIAEEGDILGRNVGEALAPKIRPIEYLLSRKKLLGESAFAAMFQGRPRPRGGKVFHEPNFYTRLPVEGYIIGFGVDLAYTKKTSADWSICLEMWRVGAGPTAKFYIVCVDRAQVEAPAFTLTLKSRSVRRPGAKMLWRASGTEKGSATFIKAQGIPLLWGPPPGDKFVSATDVAAAWNDGRVLVPSTDPDDYDDEMPDFAVNAKRWLPAFLDSIENFTGIGDEQDDDVDALGNAHKLLTSPKGTNDNDTGAAIGNRPERTV